MRKTMLFVISTIVLLIATALIANTALAARPLISSGQSLFELGKFRIVDPGVTIVTEQGTFIQNVKMVADAQAKTGKLKLPTTLLPSAQFTMTVSAFSPKKDMPGQQAGMWYIQGEWTLTKTGTTAEVADIRNNPNEINGRIQATLKFNPFEGKRAWTAEAILPMSLAAGQWGRGEGSFTVSKNGQASLFLDLELLKK